jgi:hypothetical protein
MKTPFVILSEAKNPGVQPARAAQLEPIAVTNRAQNNLRPTRAFAVSHREFSRGAHCPPYRSHNARILHVI